MTIKGQNTKSIRKKSLPNGRNPVVGVKNIKFHHQANAGETEINLTALVSPSGLSNPSAVVLAKARVKDFVENIIYFNSSAKGSLMEGLNLAWTVTSNTLIQLNFEAEEGEVFTIIFGNAIVNGVLVADVRTPGGSGDLLEGTRDFTLGEEVPIGDLTNQWPIQNFRGIDGTPMVRNAGNAEYLGDNSIGNYQMLDNGNGRCSVIRYNLAADVGGEGIFWAAHGALAERPNLSVMQQNEAVLGILNKMKGDLLETTGYDVVEPNRYVGIPTYADLAAFGNKVSVIEKLFNTPIQKTTPWVALSVQPTLTGTGTTQTINTFYWRQRGTNVEIKGSTGSSAGSGSINVKLEGVHQQFPVVIAPKNPTIPGGSDEVVGFIEAYQWQVGAQFRRLTVIKSGPDFAILLRDTNQAVQGQHIFGGGAAWFLTYEVEGWDETETLAQRLGL